MTGDNMAANEFWALRRTNRDDNVDYCNNGCEDCKRTSGGSKYGRRNFETNSEERHSPEDPAKLGEKLTDIQLISMQKFTPIK